MAEPAIGAPATSIAPEVTFLRSPRTSSPLSAVQAPRARSSFSQVSPSTVAIPSRRPPGRPTSTEPEPGRTSVTTTKRPSVSRWESGPISTSISRVEPSALNPRTVTGPAAPDIRVRRMGSESWAGRHASNGASTEARTSASRDARFAKRQPAKADTQADAARVAPSTIFFRPVSTVKADTSRPVNWDAKLFAASASEKEALVQMNTTRDSGRSSRSRNRRIRYATSVPLAPR